MPQVSRFKVGSNGRKHLNGFLNIETILAMRLNSTFLEAFWILGRNKTVNLKSRKTNRLIVRVIV